MLDFLGVTEHFSCMENTPFSFPALFRDMTGEAVSLDGVVFSGSVVSAHQEVVEISIEKGEASNEMILSFPSLPEGRWPYNVLAQADDGSQRILFSGYVSVLGISRVEALAGDAPMKNRTLLIAMPGDAAKRVRMEWLATTAAQGFAAHALQSSKDAHADADIAGKAATTATGAASTAAERAREAEGYAVAAHASQVAAGNSAASASTSADDAARDASAANDAKTAMEGLASTWPQTVSNAEQTISAAKEEAVTAIQTKQADSVLAVGRAQKTATDKVASAQGTAVTAVQTARTEAVETITPLIERAETAKESIDQAEGRIKTAATNADQSAQTASNAATAAQQALAAIPQVDAAGNMTLAGGITAAGAVNANGGINAVAMLAAGIPKTGLNAGSQAVLSVLGNVYHLDHTNGTVTTLEGSNVKMESVLAGWCGVSWVGTSTAHKCLLIKAGQSNSNYCGAWSPMGTSDYALVMSYLSGVNMVDTSTKFGWTGYSGTVAATTIEDIPGPAFYTDCVNKKVVAKNAAGETTELPWTGISLDQVSRLDFIVVPSALTSCKIYLSIHPSVRTAHGNHYNFNRRYLTPQSYYIGEVPVGLTGNDCHYAVLDNNSEQMALFRVSVIQGINPADYLNIENI